MTPAASTSTRTAPLDHTRTGARLSTPTARSVALAALSLGTLADALFRDGFGGPAFALWIALLAASLVSLHREDGGRLPREVAVWLTVAVALAASLIWRNSPALIFLDIVGALGCLSLAAMRLRNPRAGIFAERVSEVVTAAIRLAFDTAMGWIPGTVRAVFARESSPAWSGRAKPIIRAVLLTLVVFLAFGALLRSADPIFASFASLPDVDVENLAQHGFIIAVFTVIAGGWARSALLPPPRDGYHVPELGFSLAPLDIVMILATLDVLFVAFVGAQLGWLFGGEAFLRARTGLTAAEYARRGVFQVLWVVVLVVPIVIATRGAARAEPRLARRHTLLAVPMLALLGVMIVSALARLRLYVGYYGLTIDRFYAAVVMAWLFVTLVWLYLTVLRDWVRPFAAGTVAAGMVALFSLNAIDPDAIVARVNVARTSRDASRSLDLEHLATLRGGAVPYAVREIARAAADPARLSDSTSANDLCTAARVVLDRYGSTRGNYYASRADLDASWRFWNADDVRAMAAVRDEFRTLLAARHSACAAQRTRPAVAR
jgi:hypothetical protein